MKTKTLLAAAVALLLQSAHALSTPTLIATHPSDDTAFVQGFELLGDHRLLISTGLYGQSHIGIFDLQKQRYDIKKSLDKTLFGEGAAVTPYGIWQLTWRENVAFLRSFDLDTLTTAHYTGEGWGLAYDDNKDWLYMSNGSSKIQIRNAKTFEHIDDIQVHFHGKNIKFINELEFANGMIYANIWQSNFIIKINPDNGEVVKVYDMSDLLKNMKISNEQRRKIDVLNGIAHIDGDRFYVTGKFYPVIFEVILP